MGAPCVQPAGEGDSTPLLTLTISPGCEGSFQSPPARGARALLQSMEGGEGWLQGLGAAAGQGWGCSCPLHPRRTAVPWRGSRDRTNA